MRGGAFHNKIVEEAKTIFNNNGWQVYTEHRYRKHSITTYLDLLAVRGDKQLACEVETTSRHAVDNAAKALLAGLDLWIIVPSRTLRRQIEHKLRYSGLNTKQKNIRVLLFCRLEAELTFFQENDLF
jgi:UDP-3-O-acyl-N-acetylglucosamine deacetylase